jgi:hypothetical protein
MKVSEMATGIAHDGRTKVERYEWDALKERSKPMRIKIAELNVDDYQRGEAKRASTIQKARHWDHAAAGAVVVGQRADGSFWVVDGLQRTLAEALRGDIDAVDCMVFQSKGPDHEARVFQLCNLGRIPVDALHKFRVAVQAGDKIECEVAQWVRENGLRIAGDKHPNEIGFPAAVVQFWSANTDAVKRALLFTKRVGDGSMCAEVFKGAYLLISRGVDVEKYEPAIISRGGHNRLLRDINTVAIESGLSKGMIICARGILLSINYRKKVRVEI